MSNSDKAISKDGRLLHGNAATLRKASQSGGMDQHIEKLVAKEVDKRLDEVALAAGRAVREEMRKPKSALNKPKRVSSNGTVTRVSSLPRLDGKTRPVPTDFH